MTLKERCKQEGIKYQDVINKIHRHKISVEEAIYEVKNKFKHGCKKIEGLPLRQYAEKYNLGLKKVRGMWSALNE